MNLYELAKETKELKEDIKREKRNFKSKIKSKEEECKTKEKAIENYIKEALKEYEYMELKVRPISKWFDEWYPDGKATMYYPFIKIKDIYVMEYESFEVKQEEGLEMIYHMYGLRNKENGKLIEVEESAVLNEIVCGVGFEIKIEGLEVSIIKDFDISKFFSMKEIKPYKTY